MNEHTNTVHTTGYTADGFRVSFVLDVHATAETVQALLAKLDLVRAAGITPAAPGLDPGQEKETIAAVIRRTAKDGTPIIDMYPAWNATGSYGVHKYAHFYLNNNEDIQQFEQQSGLNLADLPVHDGESPVRRAFGTRHRCEVTVKSSFDVVREKEGEYENGMPKYTYSYYRLSAPPAQSAGPAHSPQQSAPQPDEQKITQFPASDHSGDAQPDAAPPRELDDEPVTLSAEDVDAFLKDDGTIDTTAFWREARKHNVNAVVINRMVKNRHNRSVITDISPVQAIELLREAINQSKKASSL